MQLIKPKHSPKPQTCSLHCSTAVTVAAYLSTVICAFHGSAPLLAGSAFNRSMMWWRKKRMS